jgi:hypothetical protein
MCAGKLSPAKPHLTNCETVVSRWSRGGCRGRWAVGAAYPCAVIAYNWRLVHGSRRHSALSRVSAARAASVSRGGHSLLATGSLLALLANKESRITWRKEGGDRTDRRPPSGRARPRPWRSRVGIDPCWHCLCSRSVLARWARHVDVRVGSRRQRPAWLSQNLI